MDLEAVRRQLDFERRTLASEGCILEGLPYVSRLRSTDAEHHMITFSALTDEIADVVIAEQAAHYRALATEVEWKVYQHDRPPDLLQRVERYGFMAGPQETVLVLDLQNHVTWIDEPPIAPVILIESEDQVDLHRRAAEEIF